MVNITNNNNNNNKTKSKLLIVDDDPDIITTFKIALVSNGYIVDSYTNPLEVVSKFKANTYDFVLLDIIMPIMDGFELFEEIKKIDPNVKVCFMTAYDVNYQSLIEIFGSPDIEGTYFKKPVEIEELIKYIDKELKKNTKN
jgi:DNA-binding NtrC family response regulator